MHNVFHVSQLQPYRVSIRYRHPAKPPKPGPPALRQALTSDTVQAILGRKYYGYTSEDGHMYKYLIKWKDQGDSSNQWVLEDDIKKNNKRHPLLTKYDTQVPYINDEPQPASHTNLTDAQKQTLYDRGNVSTGMTTDTNITRSQRKRAIPKRANISQPRARWHWSVNTSKWGWM